MKNLKGRAARLEVKLAPQKPVRIHLQIGITNGKEARQEIEDMLCEIITLGKEKEPEICEEHTRGNIEDLIRNRHMR